MKSHNPYVLEVWLFSQISLSVALQGRIQGWIQGRIHGRIQGRNFKRLKNREDSSDFDDFFDEIDRDDPNLIFSNFRGTEKKIAGTMSEITLLRLRSGSVIWHYRKEITHRTLPNYQT